MGWDCFVHRGAVSILSIHNNHFLGEVESFSSEQPQKKNGAPLPYVTVLRAGDAWLVGVGKSAPRGFRCL